MEINITLDGLIPAHAGKTPTRVRIATWRWAHPRSRGENSNRGCSTVDQKGSSPLTRGKRPRQCGGAHDCGLIPAHAGKTTGRPACRSVRWAHPRSRGENGGARARGDRRPGSSPLTRGKLGFSAHAEVPTGLIPAHAGKTSGRPSWLGPFGAHPRSRGENGQDMLVPPLDQGSSPLTRGKPLIQPFRERRAGLIPAHAGKTASRAAFYLHWRAHPRSRGENSFAKPLKARENGSSPLTRGKLGCPIPPAARGGLIPAHAGKTRGG